MNMLKDLKFNLDPKKPIYIQIADCFILNISNGNIKQNEQLPSINVFSKKYKVSRDTVEKAYKVLKVKYVIVAKKGKGTYVNNTELMPKQTVLFLINRLSTYNLKVYSSFINYIGDRHFADIEVYHCDATLFMNLIENSIEKYDYYFILPHFEIANHQQSSFKREYLEVIKRVPCEKLIIMDDNNLKIGWEIIQIIQDFENDIYEALKKGREKIKTYKKLILILPENTIYPYLKKVTKGCKRFCIEQAIDFEISIKKCEGVSINRGDLYFVVEDDDLVNLMDIIKAKNLVLGTDIGIISINETPLKKLLGITVVSTNFNEIGKTVAGMIHNDKKGKIKHPYSFIDRASI